MSARRILVAVGACAAALLVAGCAEEEPAALPARVATFNAGFAFGYVEEASQRIDPVIAALNDLDADVVCLQELWTQQEMGAWNTNVIDQVVASTTGTFPESYWERTLVPGDAPLTGCEPAEADVLLGCAEPACGDEPPENLADCVLANCSDEFSGTSAQCQNCMVTNLGQPLDAIVSACRGVTKGGVLFDGHNGLALLSKHPMSNTELLELDYALTARTALHATVELPAGPADVYCTHLAADLSADLVYPEGGTYSSYAEENLAQTDALLAWIDATAQSSTRIAMGDFNHGPGAGDIAPELVESYARVEAASMLDPIADVQPLPCTFCDANLLLSGGGVGGKLIDHVYLDAAAGENATAEVILDQVVDITGAAGDARQVNLSDHYGVVVEF